MNNKFGDVVSSFILSLIVFIIIFLFSDIHKIEITMMLISLISISLINIFIILLWSNFLASFIRKFKAKRQSFEYKYNKIKNNKKILLIDKKIKLYDMLLEIHYFHNNIIYRYIFDSKYYIIYKPFIERRYVNGKEIEVVNNMSMITFDINIDINLIRDFIFDVSIYPCINLEDIVYAIWPCFYEMEN